MGKSVSQIISINKGLNYLITSSYDINVNDNIVRYTYIYISHVF